MAKDSSSEKEARRREGSRIGTVRVDVARREKKTFDAVYKTEDRAFEIVIDEPAIRGGQSLGPTPLGYFVTGAGACLMMQYVSVLQERPYAIDDIKMMARAHYSAETRDFKDLIYEIRLTGSASDAEVNSLARQASERCFVENTLAKVVPMKSDIYLNGKKILSLERGP
jgi:uncharacterized OsmC-like protein